MLIKIGLSNVEILNREEVIKDLQEGKTPHLILKPTWYSEFATVAHFFSVPGWTLEEFEANEGVQGQSMFVDGDGDITYETNFDEVNEEKEEEEEEEE